MKYSIINHDIIFQGPVVVKCMTHNLEDPGLNCTDLLIFCVSVLRQDTSEPQPSTGKTQEIHKYVSYYLK